MLLVEDLSRLEAISGRIIVAFSGGCDSYTLLHLLHTSLSHSVEAIHVNHGLSAAADEWQIHCEAICDDLGLPLTSFRVDVKREGSLETNARSARYQVFEAELRSDDVLVMGHHRDDQVETILLNMVSGRAPLGIQGMPAERSLGRGRLVRPLLHVRREDLRQYGRDQGLDWIEDESNLDTRHDRNYLRQDVIPGLQARWPNFAATLINQWQRTDHHLAQLEVEAQTDFTALAIASDCIDFTSFADLSEVRAVALLRYWLRSAAGARVPGAQTLFSAWQVLTAKASGSPTFDMGQVCLQRFRNRIVLWEKTASPESEWVEIGGELTTFGCGVITADIVKGRGVSVPAAQLSFRIRQGGERLLVNGHHRTLKNLFQESGYPPQVRDQIPLVYDREQLIGISGIERWGISMVVGDQAQVAMDADGCDIHWSASGFASGFGRDQSR
ncbi:MAG: tRNA(Ile)-lysidine synthase [Candidatus Azotimanducaceae bacterium]|jgi:tRNA(Ile)-lysidine synthase